ncbi:hypothetical protein BFP70_17980 [Thioclava sp. SK-1]|nr:hypothetical protein BFP70_17980 [Thioclava sp. SK-1]
MAQRKATRRQRHHETATCHFTGQSDFLRHLKTNTPHHASLLISRADTDPHCQDAQNTGNQTFQIEFGD